jgi:hypothetical protein
VIALLLWSAIFAGEGGPPIALRARVVDGAGEAHTLALWRDGGHLRRDTDDRVQLLVERRDGADDRYHVVDRAHGRVFHAARTNLYRIGAFPDWSTLASLLPRRNEPLRDRGAGRTRAGACRWYDAPGAQICWSQKWHVALAVRERRDGTWRETLTVERVSNGPIAPETFAPPTALAQIDVDADVAPSD